MADVTVVTSAIKRGRARRWWCSRPHRYRRSWMRIWVYAPRRCRRGRPDLDGEGCTWEELAERYFPVFVFIEDGDDTLDEGVLVEFRHVEDLIGVEVTWVVLVDLFEPCVQFLDLFLAELAWKLGVSHLNNYYGLEYRKIKLQLLGF